MINIRDAAATMTACTRVLSAAPASADAESKDEVAYVTVLDARGIHYSSEDAAIAARHAICEAWPAGASFYALVRTFSKASGYSMIQSATIVGAVTAAFCPEYRSVIPTGT
jgi:hypothetical protein